MTNVENYKPQLHARMMRRHLMHFALWFLLSLVLLFVLGTTSANAQINIALDSGTEDGTALGTLQLMFLMALITLAPSILIMMTSFSRILIVFSFMRQAMGTQQAPSNQILVGIALFLTLFIMQPTMTAINENAYQPYKDGVLEQDAAVEVAVGELKTFMLKQTNKSDLDLFITLSKDETQKQLAQGAENPQELTALSLTTVVPSFITSEIKRAFTMGFLLYIPFLVIDIVVSSTLMSMGMVMLPPSMIAMPFKLMMFVLVDGWSLLFQTLASSFK